MAKSWLDYFFENIRNGNFASPLGVLGSVENATNSVYASQYLDKAKEGSSIDVQGIASQEGVRFTPEQEKYLNDLASQQAAEDARAYDERMSSTDLVRAYNQLESLGLNPSTVTDIGGSAYHGGNVVANTSNENVAAQKYAQQQQLARQMISMVGAMAGAGIHGGAINVAKTAAAQLASDTAITVQHMRNKLASSPHERAYFNRNGEKVGGYHDYVVGDPDDSWSYRW